MPVTVALAALVAIGTLGLWTGHRLKRPAEPPSYQRLTFRLGDIRTARFAPDQETILYSAEWGGQPMEVFSTRATARGSRSLGIVDAKFAGGLRQGGVGPAASSGDRRVVDPPGDARAGTPGRRHAPRGPRGRDRRRLEPRRKGSGRDPPRRRRPNAHGVPDWPDPARSRAAALDQHASGLAPG